VGVLKMPGQDRKLIALKQKHEVAYMIKIAREQLTKLNDGNKTSVIKLKRICKALIKSLGGKLK